MSRGVMPSHTPAAGTTRRLRQLEAEVINRRAWSTERLRPLLHRVGDGVADPAFHEIESRVAKRRFWETPRLTHLIDQVEEEGYLPPDKEVPEELVHEGV